MIININRYCMLIGAWQYFYHTFTIDFILKLFFIRNSKIKIRIKRISKSKLQQQAIQFYNKIRFKQWIKKNANWQIFTSLWQTLHEYCSSEYKHKFVISLYVYVNNYYYWYTYAFLCPLLRYTKTKILSKSEWNFWKNYLQFYSKH